MISFQFAREERLELPTPGFGDQCSNQLSYTRIKRIDISVNPLKLFILNSIIQ
jgi:hypothetical protein